MSMFSHPDEEFQRDAHRAYNDWAAEYASYAPKRLFPIANISMTDPVEDLKEVERVMKMGFRGIFISQRPRCRSAATTTRCGRQFWTAVEEYDLPVNMHILTGQAAARRSAPELAGRRRAAAWCRRFRTIAEMITGGVLEKHPDLKMMSVENDIGWLPNFLKRMDWYSYRFGPRYPQMKLSGGDYWRRPGLLDLPGRRARHALPRHDRRRRSSCGAPTTRTSTRPSRSRSRRSTRNFEGVPEDEMELILGGNMVRVYNLQDILQPSAAPV